jgi:hypothetical protein
MNCLDPGHAALFADTFLVVALSPGAICVNGDHFQRLCRGGAACQKSDEKIE